MSPGDTHRKGRHIHRVHPIKISSASTRPGYRFFPGKTKAFTLVEVVLALGLAAFALTSIMALMSVGLNSSKASSDDTVLTSMSKALVADLRRQPFTDLPGTADLPISGLPAEATRSIFFDSGGGRIKKASGEDISETELASYPQAAYRCNLTFLGDTNTLGSVAGNSSLRSVNLLRVTLTFQWPPPASAANSRVIHATVARY